MKKHLAKLVDLEYVLIHRGSRGQQFVYELVYNGEGRDGASFLVGLIDVAKLKDSADAPNAATPYDANREHPNRDREHGGSPSAAPGLQGGSTAPHTTSPNNDAAQTPVAKKHPRKSRPGTDESANRKS